MYREKYTPLTVAIEHGNQEIALWIIQRFPKMCDGRALIAALQMDALDMIQGILEQVVDLDICAKSEICQNVRSSQAMTLLMDGNITFDDNHLYEAVNKFARSGDVACIRAISKHPGRFFIIDHFRLLKDSCGVDVAVEVFVSLVCDGKVCMIRGDDMLTSFARELHRCKIGAPTAMKQVCLWMANENKRRRLE
jgi:hypothetical protein